MSTVYDSLLPQRGFYLILLLRISGDALLFHRGINLFFVEKRIRILNCDDTPSNNKSLNLRGNYLYTTDHDDTLSLYRGINPQIDIPLLIRLLFLSSLLRLRRFMRCPQLFPFRPRVLYIITAIWYNNIVAVSFLRKEVNSLSYIYDFFWAVMTNVVIYCICKWIDRS